MLENQNLVNNIKKAFELKEQGNYKQSIELLYRVLEVEPENQEVLYQIGENYYSLFNYPRALQYIEQVLSIDPNQLRTLILLRDIQIRQGELMSAKETAESIYEISKTSENLVVLVDILGRLEMFEEIDNYNEEINTDENALYELAKGFYNKQNLKQAEVYVDKLLLSNPQNQDAQILKGRILFDCNEIQKSREIFTKFDKNIENAEVLNFWGLFAMEDNDFIEAIKNFSKAANFDKNNPIYKFNLANAYFLNGWIEEAITAYKNAIKISPDNIDYRYSLAYLYLDIKDYEKANQEIGIVLEMNSKHSAGRVVKSILLLEEKKYLEAEKLLLQNISEGVEDSFTLRTLAKVEAELYNYDKAKEYISLILAKSPESIWCKVDLCDILIKQKSFEEALKIIDEVLAEKENYVKAYILGAKAAFEKGDYNRSKSYAQQAISLDINCSEGYSCLAQVWAEKKDYEEAIECLKRAIVHDINNSKYYALMSEIYELAGDNQSAFAYIKEAESITPSEEYKSKYKKLAASNRK